MKNLTKTMQTFILAALITFFGCENVSTEPSVSDCIVGTFGSNVPMSYFSAEMIAKTDITLLEKQLLFRSDGTGYYYLPSSKGGYGSRGEIRVDFDYKIKDEILTLTAKIIYANGMPLPVDDVVKNNVLIQHLKLYNLFSNGLEEVISFTCTKDGIKTDYKSTVVQSPLGNVSTFGGNQIYSVKSWIKRN